MTSSNVEMATIMSIGSREAVHLIGKSGTSQMPNSIASVSPVVVDSAGSMWSVSNERGTCAATMYGTEPGGHVSVLTDM